MPIGVAQRLRKSRSVPNREIPGWLQEQADLWIKHRSVSGVVLFGSRATGHAHSRSDWDVAILYSGEPPENLQFSSGLRNRDVDIGIFPSDQVWRESHVAGTVAYELRNCGIELVGEMPKENNKDIVISEEELARHLQFCFRNLATSIRSLDENWDYESPTGKFENLSAGVATGTSANGAERVAKALCVYLGVTYSYSHDVASLADLVPEEWKSKVLAMNGNTKPDHLFPYTEREESVGIVTNRIRHAINLLSNFLEPALKKLSFPKVDELFIKLGRSREMNDLEALSDQPNTHSLLLSLRQDLLDVHAIVLEHYRERTKEQI